MIFVSYSHKDQKIFQEFKTMLAPAAQGGLLEVWDDQKIRPGEKWEEKIRDALSAAEIAVLLVSQHFLASHFITQNELLPILNAARGRGIVVFWIYVSSCLFEKTEIKSYQAAYDVSRPLDLMKRAERQAALSEICFKLIDTQSRISYEKATKTNLAVAAPLPQDNREAHLECCLLISEALESADATRFGGPTTVIHRRLDLAQQWLEKGIKLLPDCRNRLPEPLAAALGQAKQTLLRLVSHAERVLPEPGGIREPREDQYYLDAQDSTRHLMKRVQEELQGEAEFTKLKNSNRKWAILGFRDQADYEDYLFPSLKRLAKSTDPMQRDLFERLLRVPEFTPRQLAQEGYRRDLVMDSLNALLTEKWAEWTGTTIGDDASGRVTEVGKRLLKQFLEKN
jgi:TIR domain